LKNLNRCRRTDFQSGYFPSIENALDGMIIQIFLLLLANIMTGGGGKRTVTVCGVPVQAQAVNLPGVLHGATNHFNQWMLVVSD
jgi:hypothetical protein